MDSDSGRSAGWQLCSPQQLDSQGGRPTGHTRRLAIFFSQVREKTTFVPSQASNVSEQRKCDTVDLQRVCAHKRIFQSPCSDVLIASASICAELGISRSDGRHERGSGAPLWPARVRGLGTSRGGQVKARKENERSFSF